ncbi:cTAGE family member 9 [Vulpes lagopus]
MEVLPSFLEHVFGLMLGMLGEMVVELLPSYLSSLLIFHNLQWETVMCLPVIGLLVGLLFIFRLIQSVRSHLYRRHERQLAKTLAAGIEEKCQLIDKLCVAKEEYVGIELSLENARLEKESFNIGSLRDSYRKGKRINIMLMEELNSLVQELKEERSKTSKQEEQMAEMLKVLQSLEQIMRIITSKGAFPNLPGDEGPRPIGPFPRSGPES